MTMDRAQAALWVLLPLLAAAVAAAALLAWNLRRSRRDCRRLAFRNRCYRELCALSNEFLFEYDVGRDELRLEEYDLNRLPSPGLVTLFTDEEYAGEAGRLLREFLRGTPQGVGEFRCALPDGSSRWLRVCSKLLSGGGESPVCVAKVTDIQREREEWEVLMDRAQRDSLTGVFNAATSRELITSWLKSPSSDSAALIMLDVDRFKQVNDHFGHFCGDRTLREIAEFLLDSFRKKDVVGRLGGDEFVVLMKDVPGRHVVEEKCRMLNRDLISRLTLEEGGTVTLSIGVALAEPGQKFDELYKRADRALYDVKKQGRNGFEIQ